MRRIRIATGFLIAGLVLSGLTAIPIRAELEWLAAVFGIVSFIPAALCHRWTAALPAQEPARREASSNR